MSPFSLFSIHSPKELATSSYDSNAPMRWLWHGWFWLVMCWAGLCTQQAHAAINTSYATMSRHADGVYAVNADFRLSLPLTLQEAVNHGTPLSFQVEFTVNRPRWYWSNDEIARVSREQRITYNSLTQEYRVTLGTEQYRYKTLNEALLNLSRVSQWRVLAPHQVQQGEQYQAAIRITLNTYKLPRTYQLNSMTNNAWGLRSNWYEFNFTPR